MNVRLAFVLLLIIPYCASASIYAERKEKEKFSIATGSFVYHIIPNGNYNQYFKNDYLVAAARIAKNTSLTVGTLKNSFANRCLNIGVKHDWHDFSPRFSFVGSYSYTGEFFFYEFKNCGNDGSYNYTKKKYGIGFLPYIYHGLEYDVTKFLSIEVGVILPVITITTLKWNIM